jgi:hypothetical protein
MPQLRDDEMREQLLHHGVIFDEDDFGRVHNPKG